MDHPFTWYDWLPAAWQAWIPLHTFFALVTMAALVLFAWRARAALRRAKDPTEPAEGLGARNLAELLVEFVMALSDGIVGKNGRKYLPLFGSFFAFILLANLSGLAPGFSPPTSNLNTTLGLAIVSFIAYNVFGLREQGTVYLKHFCGPMTGLPATKSWFATLLFIPLLVLSVSFFFVVELGSHLFRPLSLSLRLFGNMLGDHIVIEVFTELTKVVVPVVFLGLGTLVSIIQAFVFTMLSMIYVALAVSHGHEEEHGHH